MGKVKIDGLADAVMKELQEYSEETTENIKNNVMDAGKVCLYAVREKSPVRFKKYRRGWKLKKVHESYNDIRVRVQNPSCYQLTHLLEDGHDLVAHKKGKYPGKVLGRVKGKAHIEPAEKLAETKLMKDVKISIKGK